MSSTFVKGLLHYDAMLAVGAVAEICEHLCPDADDICTGLHRLQKRLKYGLPYCAAIVHEIGFADRVLLWIWSLSLVDMHEQVFFC